jgi:hypothetical protein
MAIKEGALGNMVYPERRPFQLTKWDFTYRMSHGFQENLGFQFLVFKKTLGSSFN